MPDRYTLVLSDVHLCGVVPADAAWMTYRQRRFLFDDDLARLLDVAVRAARGGALEVVLNGDLFDFDAPDTRGADGAFHGSAAYDEAGAADLLDAILRDHPAVLWGLGRVLRAGQRVVVVPGNHDAPLAFPAVRDVLRAHLGASAGRDVAGQVLFRTLFYRTADGVHVEHGHQYDPLCTLDVPLPRIVAGRRRLESTVGSVASSHVPEIYGCLNPYGADPFDLSLTSVVALSDRCMRPGAAAPALARRLIAVASFARELALVQPTRTVADLDALAALLARETGAPLSVVRRHVALFEPKGVAGWMATAAARSTYSASVDASLRAASEAIGALYDCRGVVMGHTHAAHQRWQGGRFLANTGSWAATTGLAGGAYTAAGTYAWICSGATGMRAAVRHYAAGDGTL